MSLKKIVLIGVLLIVNTVNGQELRVGFGYSNLHSKQLDYLIQTYNFSRPFLQSKQPLLSHGFSSSMSYVFSSKKRLASGLSFGYSLFGSKAKNSNMDLKLDLNLFELGYVLKYTNQEKIGNFYGEVELDLVLGVLNKKTYVENVKLDSETNRAFQFGGLLSFNIGYSFRFNDRMKIEPFVNAQYSPYFNNGNAELVINQSKGLINEKFNSVVRFNLGLKFTLNKL